jgi:hypothetical protein
MQRTERARKTKDGLREEARRRPRLIMRINFTESINRSLYGAVGILNIN